MTTRSLIFTCNPGMYSDTLIRTFDGSLASHVGCRVDDYVIDSAFKQNGVKKTDYGIWVRKRKVIAEIPVIFTKENALEADSWLEKQLHKKYDVTAIAGFLFFGDWSDEDKWFCSELAMAWCIRGGWTLIGEHSRIAVRLLLEVAFNRAAVLSNIDKLNYEITTNPTDSTTSSVCIPT